MSSDARIEWLPARKGEQPLGQLRGALRADKSIVECPFCPGLDNTPFGNAEIAYNDREKIVEVVRNATGQLANGFHLLRLPKGLLCHIASFGFRIQGSCTSHCQQNKCKEHQRGRNAKHKMAGHCAHPAIQN